MIKKLLFLLVAIASSGYSQNNYLDFDGVDDIIETPTSTATTLANATSLTLSCKVFPTRVSAGFPDFNGFAGYRNETNFDFYLIQLSSTDVEARFRNAAGAAFTITYTGLQLNQWNHFFLVYNGSTLKLYKGTTEVGSVPASGAVPSTVTGYLSIGRISFSQYDWTHKGLIDEVSMWNKALLPADISAIIGNSGEIVNPSGETNLKMYYKFNQGIAYGNNAGLTTLNDEMGMHNGVLGNFALTGNSSNWGGTTLAIDEFGQDRLSIYPNPASNYISVGGLTETSNIQIVDMMGRIVLSNYVETASDPRIDISSLNSGIYFLIANDTQKIRFVKN